MAANITPSLRNYRDYTAVGRRAFLVEHLETGALPIYDKDPGITAYVVGEEGDNVLAVAKPLRVFFPLFEIAANPQVPLTQAQERRYDLIKRSIELGVSAIKEKEDVRVFAAVDALAADSSNPHPDITSTGNLTASALADAVSFVTEMGLRVARIFMNGRDYADIRKFDRDVLDQETQQHLLRTGYVGRIYGAQIIESRVITRGTVYVAAEREFFGRMPVRQELAVITADVPEERLIGFSMFQNLGIGCYNGYASQRFLISRSS